MLPEAVIDTYHRELTAVLDAQGVDAFRIGGGEELPYKQLVVCCGGPASARLSGFPELVQTIAGFDVTRFGEMPTQLTISSPNRKADGEIHLRNSLIGHMLARVVVLFFVHADHYDAWLRNGVEASFLKLTQPANQDKHFVVICPDPLPLDEIQALTGAGSISTSIDWASALNRFGGYTAPGFGGMVLVPSGEFEGFAIEAPFLISQAEVTQDIYKFVTGITPSRNRSPDRPAIEVSWLDMLRFSNELSGDDDSCYTNIPTAAWRMRSPSWEKSCRGFRLPAVREWQYAARAFSPFTYSGGDDSFQVAWGHEMNGAARPVGQLRPNAFGTYDMSGNVWEWCWDAAPARAESALPGVEAEMYRATCGGSRFPFDSHMGVTTPLSTLHTVIADYRVRNVGGRLARSLV